MKKLNKTVILTITGIALPLVSPTVIRTFIHLVQMDREFLAGIHTGAKYDSMPGILTAL